MQAWTVGSLRGVSAPAASACQRPRIAVDLMAPGMEPSSLGGTLSFRLIEALAHDAPDCEFVLLAPGTHPGARLQVASGNVSYCAMPGPGPLVALLQRAQGRVPERIRERWLQSARFRRRSLRSARLRQRPGVLARLGATSVLCPFTSASVRDASVPVVAVVHDLQHLSHPHLLTSQQRARRARAFMTTAREADTLICVTREQRTLVLEHTDCAPDRVLSIAPGRLLVGPEPPEPAVASTLLRYALRENDFLLMVGNCEPRQNHWLLATALGMLRARVPGAHLKLVCVAAPDRGLAQFRLGLERMGLADAVQIVSPGAPDEVLALVSAARAVVVPSLYEPLGEVVLQAMAMRRPVLCSRLANLAELAGEAPLYFDPHRPSELADLFEQIARGPDVLERAAHLGRQWLAQLDEPGAVAHAYLQTLCRSSR